MAEAAPFKFEAHEAERENVPLLIGLTGASGGGKTYTALRLALGIQSVVGGDIYYVDTENRRALHYAGQKTPSGAMIRFKHVPFPAPYGSLKYRDALRYCVSQKPGVIVLDSMSHEHESEGGLLDSHERELDRIAGDDWAKRERANMLAWAKPKEHRRKLLLEIQKLQANVIFCFRAKTVAKPVKLNGRTEVVPQGFVPIAGDEFVFEMTLNALLLPHSNGVATWESEFPGERMAIKLPAQFKSLASNGAPMDEELGARLATWARGGKAAPTSPPREEPPAAAPQEVAPPVGDRPAPEVTTEPEAVPEPAQEAASTTGFVDFAGAVADANEWPQIQLALGELFKTPEWAAADDLMKANARKCAFHRLQDLNAGGLKFDFITNAHAWRCYIEFEDNRDVLQLNAAAFRGSQAFLSLSEPNRALLEKALAARMIDLEPLPAKDDAALA